MEKKQLLMIPGPTNLPNRVLQAMAKPMINHRGPEFHALYDRIMENMRYAFETKGDTIVFSASGTGGVEAVIANFLGNGEKIIVAVNGDFSHRIEENVRCFGGIPIVLNVQWGKAPTAGMIEQAVEKEKDAKVLFVIYNETSTGALTKEMEEIARIARKYDRLLAVDAISNFAGDTLPMDRWGVDIVVAGSQKCLACPPGLVLVALNSRAWDFIKNRKAQSNYWDLHKYKAFNERKETPFTPAVSLYFALDEALQMLREEGLEKRIARHAKMANAFYAMAEALGLELFADPSCRAHTVIAFKNPQGIDVRKMRTIMEEKYGVVIAGGMGAIRDTTFRIGSMGIVSAVEVNATIEALENALMAVGYKSKPGAGLRAAQKVLE
jgi:aspartate aminotransferase-like enzyme